MKRESFILSILLLGAPAASLGFTLDIASQETGDSGQGPRAIFVPGYGEVTFESVLDGVLVLDSAYASTNGIEPPPPTGETPARGVTASASPGFVEIAHPKTPALSPPPQSVPYQVGPMVNNAPGGWNAVPETASATLGLVGTLLLILRRNTKPATSRS